MWSLFSRNAAASLPFEILDVVSEDERMIWKLHKGKRKGTHDEVSIFICEDVGTATLDLAKAAIKRLKTLKHPCVLTYLDSLETDKAVYLVTEAVQPLLMWLSASSNSSNHSNVVSWGLYQVTKGLSFMNNDAKLVHNNICSSSIFVTRGGEWKLFGLEYTSSDVDYVPIKVLPQLLIYEPPDLRSGKKRKFWTNDSWSLGCLVWEVFNGRLDKTPSLQHTSKIPKALVPTYCELVAANPASRPNLQDVAEKLRKPGNYFANDLIETVLTLEEVHLMTDVEKNRFFTNLTSAIDNIPKFICKNKVLPALLKAYEFSNVSSAILTPLFKVGNMLEISEYQSQIVPCVIKMFSSNDRSTRLKLLQQMESLSEHLDSKTINEQIFNPLVTGFHDTNPAIRECTIKSILYLAPKLNHQNLNSEVLKHFARLQSRDDQGGIRTNTTVCLGKIASYLHPDTRKKCLVSAFSRAMKDPFPPSRIAGVTALAATQQYYHITDVATKIMPALSCLCIDHEKSVRDAVFRVLKGFVGKLEKVSDDPDLKEIMEKEVSSASSSTANASNWAGWAVGALASKFYKTSINQKVPDSAKGATNPSGSSESTSTSTLSSSSSSFEAQDRKPREQNPQAFSKQTESVSSERNFADLMSADDADALEGWDDEENWASLDEVEEYAPLETKNEETPAAPLNPSASLSKVNDDSFFASFNPPKSTLTTKPREVSSPKDSWDDWGDDSTSFAAEPSSKAQDAKRQREEKRTQRQKEIEAKRAARSGPMKLGARKL